MKITYFLTGLGLSGGPMIIYNFMNGLVKKGHEVYMVTMDESFKWKNDTYKEFINKKTTKRKIRVFCKIEYYKILFYFNTFLKFLGFSNKLGKDKVLSITEALTNNYNKLGIDSDVFIATMTYTGDAVYKLGLGKKIVMHNQHFEEIHFTDKDARAGIQMLTRLPFNHIVNCEWLDKMFKYNYGITGTVIRTGVDTDIFNAPIDSKKYLENGNKPIKLLTYCDPRRKFKGTPQQISILEKLYEKNKNIEISMYGLDPKTAKFPYTFLGWISQQQLVKFYAESHILISFSWYEAGPLPPLEAMACGCAVVAGKYGTEDYLIQNETGLIINPFNIEESVETINGLIKQPHVMLKLAHNGKKMIEKFSWAEQIEKLNNFLMNLPTPESVNITEIQNGNLKELDKIYA